MGKTGPKCSICSHKSRHQIEIGLAHGIAHNALARRFNVSADAVGRHAANHVSPAMRAAILTAQKPTEIDLEALQASEQEGLLSQLVHQRARLQQHVATAIDFADIKAAISAEGAITANLALVGKLLGMIVQRHDVRSTSLLDQRRLPGYAPGDRDRPPPLPRGGARGWRDPAPNGDGSGSGDHAARRQAALGHRGQASRGHPARCRCHDAWPETWPGRWIPRCSPGTRISSWTTGRPSSSVPTRRKRPC